MGLISFQLFVNLNLANGPLILWPRVKIYTFGVEFWKRKTRERVTNGIGVKGGCGC